MFDKFTGKICRQNIKKIKELHQSSLRRNQSEDSSSPRDHDDSFSLSDIDIQLEEREVNFNRIMSMPDPVDSEYRILKNQNMHTPPSIIRKYQCQLELSNEKMKLQQQTHRKQISSIKQFHLKQKQFLEIENTRMLLQLSKQKKIRSNTKQMKGQINCLIQINQLLKKRCEQNQKQNGKMKTQINNLNEKINSLISQNNKLQGNKGTPQIIIEFEKKMKNVQEEKDHWKKSYQKKSVTVQKLTYQLTKIKQQLHKEENRNQQTSQALKYNFQKRIQLLQKQNNTVTQRNKHLEQIFIEKLSEATRFQATMLTQNQTSLSKNQVSLDTLQVPLENTLNLQEQSPIRPQPQSRQNPNKLIQLNNTHKRQMKFQDGKELINNPERKSLGKSGTYRDHRTLTMGDGQSVRMRQKLNYANMKIVQLIQDKIRNEQKINELARKVGPQK